MTWATLGDTPTNDGTCCSWAGGKNGKYFEITELKARPQALDVNK